MLVFYGDHLPAFYPPSVFAANTAGQMHRTPYFVWASFPARGRGGPPSGPGPAVVSPTHFVDLAAERAGAAVTPYYALLTELRAQVPALEDRTLLGTGGHPGAARPALAQRPAAAAGLPARAVRPLGRAPVRPDGPARAALSGPGQSTMTGGTSASSSRCVTSCLRGRNSAGITVSSTIPQATQ